MGGTIVLQILEGFWYYSMGEQNCGTQGKLSAILSGALFVLLAYKYIESDKEMSCKYKTLHLLGDCSFGIYFSHIAVMAVLNKIPHYTTVIIFPFNAIIAVAISCVCVLLGKKILGKYGKYVAV